MFLKNPTLKSGRGLSQSDASFPTLLSRIVGQGEKGVHPPVRAELCTLPLSSSEDDIAEAANSALERDVEEVCPPAASDVVPPSVVADASTENETCDETNAEDVVAPLDPSQSMFDTETTDVVSGQRKRPLPDSWVLCGG